MKRRSFPNVAFQKDLDHEWHGGYLLEEFQALCCEFEGGPPYNSSHYRPPKPKFVRWYVQERVPA